MESRRRLYKAGPRDNATLTERVQRHKVIQNKARIDKFSSARQINIEDSPTTPRPARRAVKVSEIDDKIEKLKAYRLEKNTKKVQEMQVQKSPFILTVPVGRWVEKKERQRPFKMELNQTPVKAALMSERVIKKSTVKQLIAKSTVKKENVMVFNGKAKNPPLKSKKKILGDSNSTESLPTEKPSEEEFKPIDLNSTFEITPEKEENEVAPATPVEAPPPQRLRRSKSFADIVKLDVESEKLPAKAKTPPAKSKTPPAKSKTPPTKSRAVSKRQMTAVIKKPVIKPSAAKKEAPVKRQASVPVKKKTPPVKPVPVETPQSTQEPEPVQPEEAPKPAAKKKAVLTSACYSLYSSTLNTQVKFLTMSLSNLSSNKESFFELLPEDQQMSIEQTIQQGNILITDKLGKFAEFLEKFEEDENHPEKLKRITEDDVENYWYLIYEEVEKLKSDLAENQTIKNNVLASVASAKKRRTRRTYVPDDGTPKRSKRLAGNADTPKHNASCYGCVTMSASKINTPKSAKRRTTGKKSVAFDNVETPKRSDSNRRATKIHKATPKRNLMRMRAVDGDADEEDLSFN